MGRATYTDDTVDTRFFRLLALLPNEIDDEDFDPGCFQELYLIIDLNIFEVERLSSLKRRKCVSEGWAVSADAHLPSRP